MEAATHNTTKTIKAKYIFGRSKRIAKAENQPTIAPLQANKKPALLPIVIWTAIKPPRIKAPNKINNAVATFS